jgi:glycine cleavage system H protein
MSHEGQIQEYSSGLLWYMAEDESFLIGVTQFALDSLGGIVRIETGEAKDEFEFEDWLAEIEGKNSVLEVTAPFNLIVEEVNSDVLGQTSVLEDDPTGDAWLLRVKRL